MTSRQAGQAAPDETSSGDRASDPESETGPLPSEMDDSAKRSDQTDASRGAEAGLSAIGDGTLLETIMAAQALGIDAKSWSFEQLMEANNTLRTFSTEREKREAEAEVGKRQAVLENRETNVRFALALLLVFGSVAGVFAGIVIGLPPEEVAQYLAPITGLAGIAVGYFFGRATQ